MFALLVPSALAATVYVDGRVGSSGGGASWATAMKTIQEGIDAAAGSGGGDVWVVKGTYLEAITMKSNVLLYGGFLGTESDLLERAALSNITTIDASTARGGLPAYHVVVMDSLTSCTVRLDGFTITGGVADGPGSEETFGGGVLCMDFTATSATITNCTINGNSASVYGGGVLCDYASPTITNCTISGNSTNWVGGGVYCSQSSPTITDCTISGNSAPSASGGGVYCENSSPTIENCTITVNTARSGGGVCCRYASPTITNCSITGNWAPASGGGGGVYCYQSPLAIISCTIRGNSAQDGGGVLCIDSSPTITDCWISGNSASNCGGGVYCGNASPTITNCAIRENFAIDGGGVSCSDNASPTIANCTISGNTVVNHGGGVSCSDNASPTITNCTISENSATIAGGGVSCRINALPTITNCTISGNSAGEGGGVFCLSSASPTITNCPITGNSAGAYGGGVSCYASSPTITCCMINGNSAVYAGGVYCRGSSSPTITNCTISGNSADVAGGGLISTVYCSPIITNCAINENSAAYGGGMYSYDSTSPTITNCTISGNSAGYGGGGVYCYSYATPTISYSLLFNNLPNDYFDNDRRLSYTGALEINANVPGAVKNISGDPLFLMDGPKGIRGTWTAAAVYDPLTTRTLLTDTNAHFTPGALVGRFINTDAGQYLQSYITSNTLTQIEVFGDVTGFAAQGESYKVMDYHLREGSPCINAGDNNAPGLTARDMDGDPRIVFDTVDIGADEFDPPPCVTEAVCNDSNNNGTIEPGESLTLVMNRSVLLTNLSSASNFYLPVAGDSLGGPGFDVQLSPRNSRHVVVTLGAGANLTVGGTFDMANLTPGSPSGVDIAANLTSGTILSLTGKNAVDGGVEGVNDSGKDIFFTCIQNSAVIGATGGTIQVQVSPNAAYTRHALIIPAGALSANQTFTLRPPENNGGVLGAVQIDTVGAGGGGGGGIKIKAVAESRAGVSPALTVVESRAGVSPAKPGEESRAGVSPAKPGQGQKSLNVSFWSAQAMLAPCSPPAMPTEEGGKPSFSLRRLEHGSSTSRGASGYSLVAVSPRFSQSVSVSSVVENLPTLSQAGTPALPSQTGTPVLPSQAGTPALLSRAGTPALLSQAGTPALPSQAGTPVPLSAFAAPVELEIEYRESDVDREQGVVEAAMEVHQLVENPAGVFTWRQIPGDHHVDPVKNTVKVAVTDLNPCGSIGTIRVFAVIPGWTIEPVKTYIRPKVGGGGVRIVARLLRQSGADASPGETGDYRLHQIDIPNYEVTTADDPERIVVEISRPKTPQLRGCPDPPNTPGTFFPVEQSCAVFAVSTMDATSASVAFASPVNIRVQFMNGTVNKYNDLVDFHSVPGLALQMRVVHDAFVGWGVDFAFLGQEIPQVVNTRTGTVEAFEVTCLTDSTGEGVWGAVVDSGVKPAAARCWEIYE